MNIERESQSLSDDFENGLISESQYVKMINDLEKEYANVAEESAQNAYDEEMGRW